MYANPPSTNPVATAQALLVLPKAVGMTTRALFNSATMGLKAYTTNPRYHVYVDEVLKPMKMFSTYLPAISGVLGQNNVAGMEHRDWYIDLKGVEIDWYDAATATSQIKNKLYLAMIADYPPSNVDNVPCGYFFADLEYEDL